jgi:hypothetical protein
MNSLAQLTSYQPLSAGMTVPFLPEVNVENVRLLPLFSLWLQDKGIMSETFSYLLHYAQMAG